MSVRPDSLAAKDLSVKQKLALFLNTSLSSQDALKLTDDELTFETFVKHGVRATNISAAGLRMFALKNYGVKSPSQLRRLGYDALHLVDAVFASDVNAAFGAREVLKAFLHTPQDAVALAGSDAVDILNVTLELLLSTCAGSPLEASAVLEQQPSRSLKGVRITTLLDTGLRAPQLKALGYNLASMRELHNSDGKLIAKLGFSI